MADSVPTVEVVFEAADLAVDGDPLKLRNAIFAGLAVRRATTTPGLRTGKDYADGWTDGHNRALIEVRKAIAAALGIQEGGDHG